MEKYEKVVQMNKFKTSALTWNDKFELPDGSYSVLDIQDQLEYIIRKYETVTDNPPITIYGNKSKIKLYLKLKQGIISNF